MTHHQLRKYIPYIEAELLQAIEAEGLFKELPKGSTLLREGAYVPGVPLVLSGRIKALTSGDEKELLLYYIEPGESCVMSLSACLNQSPSKIVALVEEDSEVLLIPATRLDDWLRQFPSLNRFLFDLHNRRYLDLLDTIDQLVFGNLEERMIRYLEKRCDREGSSRIHCTHQEIARDLGSSREVISRMLKKLEVRGRLKMGKHLIELIK